MSEFKKGDRVTASIEGRIAELNSVDADIVADVSGGLVATLPLAVLEKLPDPLPTTPGSVIRYRNGNYRFLHSNGTWISAATLNADGLSAYAAAAGNNYEIIHDAGKASS